MDLLKTLISKKKKEFEEVKPSSSSSSDTRWVKSAEFYKKEDQRAIEEQRLADEKKKAGEAQRLAKLDAFIVGEQQRKRKLIGGLTGGVPIGQGTCGSNGASDDIGGGSGGRGDNSSEAEGGEKQNDGEAVDGDDDETVEPPLSLAEVFRRLRRLGEAITLFGETPMKRYRRLCIIEVARHEDDLMGGQQNLILQLLGSDNTPQGSKKRGRRRSVDDDLDLDDDDLDDDRKRQKRNATGGGDTDGRKEEQSGGGDKTTHNRSDTAGETRNSSTDANTAAAQQDGKSVAAQKSKATSEGGETGAAAEDDREDHIRRWIRQMLSEWELELQNRTDAEKKTAEARLLTAQYRQTRKDLRPLLRKLKQRELDEAVLDQLYRMTRHCEAREYVRAHDRYIELAIGKAAWPMGVTMVGIHERAGRSKIFSSEIAHILNDETTRKYIQMFKRLMSFCQRRYPVDPSQMVKISV